MISPRWPFYFLPTNPCCGTLPCDPCSNPQADITKQSDNMIYTGANLPCLGIDTNDTLTVCLQKIEAALCPLTTTTTSSSSTTTTTTTEIL